MEIYPKKLIQLRKKSGLTVKHITKQLDIGRSTYWNWENGMRTPSENHARELARLLNISVNEISDLIEAVKVKEDMLFGDESNWEHLTQDRGKEIANRQKTALGMIAATTEELNKVWSIVQGLMESLDTILYIKDLKSKYILANSAFRKNLGLMPSFSVSGKEDSDFYSKNEARSIFLEDQNIINTGIAIHHRMAIIPGSRKKKWGLISKHPIYDHKGKVSGLVSTYDDITEMRELQRFHALMETGIKHSNDIFSIRESGEKNQIYVSESVSKNFGYSRQDFAGEDGYSFFINTLHPDYVEQELKYRKNNSYPKQRQYQIYKANGDLAWIENSSTMVMHEGKEYICSVSRDITQHKKDDMEINELRNIIKSLDYLAIWRADVEENGEFTFTFVSDNIEKIIGYSKESIVNQKIILFDVVYPDHKLLFEDWLIKKDYFVRNDHKIVCADNSEKWIETNIIPCKKNDKVITITATHTDITDRKKIELNTIKSHNNDIIAKNKLLKKEITEKLKKEGMSPEKIAYIIGDNKPDIK